MGFILPLSAFIFGLFIAQYLATTTNQIKKILSTLLAKFFIPVVIVYNLVFYQSGSFSLILLSFSISVFLFYLYRAITKQPLKALCFSYVNMAWLGFPFAIALFGPTISSAMVAIYIGGSIFGNVWAVMVLTKQESFGYILKKLLISPPIMSIIIALICRFFGVQNWSSHMLIDWIYSLSKIAMSFSGMCVLGIWLRHTKVYLDDFIQSLKTAFLKILCGVVICTGVYVFIPIPYMEKYIGVIFLLFCLPPAANIVALETHYQGTGHSAKIIASGTIVSCLIVLAYGLILHIF